MQAELVCGLVILTASAAALLAWSLGGGTRACPVASAADRCVITGSHVREYANGPVLADETPMQLWQELAEEFIALGYGEPAALYRVMSRYVSAAQTLHRTATRYFATPASVIRTAYGVARSVVSLIKFERSESIDYDVFNVWVERFMIRYLPPGSRANDFEDDYAARRQAIAGLRLGFSVWFYQKQQVVNMVSNQYPEVLRAAGRDARLSQLQILQRCFAAHIVASIPK